MSIHSGPASNRALRPHSFIGYSIADEFPILLLLFAVPAAAAVLVRWRFI